MKNSKPVIWFVTGSQHLYGEEALKKVSAHAQAMVAALNAGGRLPLDLDCRPVMVSPEGIRQLALEANSDPACAGLVLWMHTFSPAKMWIGGPRRPGGGIPAHADATRAQSGGRILG
jgi:L-arabinose isomerase